MKLTHIILILSLFFASCAPVIKPHGYQLEDILLSEPQTIGTSTKEDLEASYGSPSIKIEDVGNTAAFLGSDLSAGMTGEILYVDAGYRNLGMNFDME